MKYIFILLLTVVSSLVGYSQTAQSQQADKLPVVGVSPFKADSSMLKFTTIVSAKVVEVLTQSQRFNVVDRTNYDQVRKEIELQKTEAFMDSKDKIVVASLNAQFMVIGNISKFNILRMKNNDGSINGYRASVNFQLQVTDVASGANTNAETFQTVTSPIMLSTESAVTDAVNTIEPQLAKWIVNNFPVTVKLLKVMQTDGDEAATVLVSGGKKLGLSQDNRLIVQFIEMLDGSPYPTELGELKVIKLAGETFAECKVIKGGKEILSRFNAAQKLVAVLKIN